MLKRQRNLRIFLNHIPALHSHHRIMTSLIRNDPFFKGFHCLPQPAPASYTETCRFLLLRNNVSMENGHGFRINGVVGMTLKGCSDSCKAVNDPRARTLAPHHQLVRDFEARLEDSNPSSRLVNGHTACQGGKPLGFLDYPSTEKVMVAVDVDEVLGSFVSALNRFIADRYSLNHSVSEYHVYEFFKIWNCSQDEADIRVHEFFKTPYFKRGIHPIPGAQKVLRRLSRLCKLSVVTYVILAYWLLLCIVIRPVNLPCSSDICINRSRQNVIKDHTIEWLEEHYPGVFEEIHFGNHFALDGESRPKSEICRSLGAKVLIDDNPRYAIECAEVGIRVLLFDFENSYPWSKADSVDEHPLVTRVHNWEQVERQLVSWIVS